MKLLFLVTLFFAQVYSMDTQKQTAKPNYLNLDKEVGFFDPSQEALPADIREWVVANYAWLYS